MKIEGGTLICDCGKKYHVSLFRDLITAGMREVYALVTADEDEVIERGIKEVYERGGNP